MSLEDDYPLLTNMLDRYLRPEGTEDEDGVERFLAEAPSDARRETVSEIDTLLRAEQRGSLDPFELRLYLMVHRFAMIPEDGAVGWMRRLRALLDGPSFS